MSNSNETRKPTGRPSLLSAEQQSALEQHKTAPVAASTSVAPAARRTHVWLVAGAVLLAVAATFAVVQSGDAGQPAVTLAAQEAAPAPAPAQAPAASPAAEVPSAAPAEAAPPASQPEAAAIVDEAPQAAQAKPKESLAQMLESGVPPAAKPTAAPKAVRKPARPGAAKIQDKGVATAAPEEDNDVELLAALVAHAKYDNSANARVTLPKALEQCKKQGKQDAARCRIRVCDGRWKKDECRVYNRSKLEKAASGS